MAESIFNGKEWEQMSFEERLAIKVASESSFINFVRIWFELTQNEPLMVNWHHIWFANEVDKIIRGVDGSSLAIAVPPGSTKTEFFSIFIHPYTLALIKAGVLKKFRNLALSSGKALVERNSKRVMDVISSPEYQELWPCVFSKSSVEEWSVVNDKFRTIGGMVSRPMMGGIIGSRGGYPGPGYSGSITIDDGDKAEDMFSSLKRERSHRLLTNTVRSRRGDKSKAHPTPVVIIQQRLHKDDSIGFCMNGGMGIDFRSIVVPAMLNDDYVSSLPDDIRSICIEHTKDSPRVEIAGAVYWSFWEEMEGIDQLIRLREIDEYTFLSQYMQDPISLSGNIFNPDHFQWYGDEEHPRPPSFDYRFITVDTAQKTKEVNDFSVMMEWGVFEKNLYAIDMLRGKWEAPELQANFERFVCEKWDDNSDTRNGNLRDVLVEDKSSGTGLIQYANGRMPIGITAVQRNTDKLTRAMDTVPIIKQGKVWLPVGKPWATEFVSEHAQFTADDSHKHDDIVDNTMDAVSHAFIKGSSLLEALYSRR